MPDIDPSEISGVWQALVAVCVVFAGASAWIVPRIVSQVLKWLSKWQATKIEAETEREKRIEDLHRQQNEALLGGLRNLSETHERDYTRLADAHRDAFRDLTLLIQHNADVPIVPTMPEAKPYDDDSTAKFRRGTRRA